MPYERDETARNRLAFEVSPRMLSMNADFFLGLPTILDDLTIELDDDNSEHPINAEYIYHLLQKFHEKGIFKRLHVNIKNLATESFDQMIPLDALKGLCLYDINYDADVPLPQWMNLIELKVNSFIMPDPNILSHQLKNLGYATFDCMKFDDLLEFIRRLVHLRKIKVESF